MTVENTSNRDPLIHLLGAMADGPSDYITGMESAGQRQLVNSAVLPTRCDEQELAAIGVTLGEPVQGDVRAVRDGRRCGAEPRRGKGVSRAGPTGGGKVTDAGRAVLDRAGEPA